MIITVSGTAGSGKSTAAKKLAQILKAERIYVGGIRRKLAQEKGMSLIELNQYALTHPETDVDLDNKAAAEAKILEKKGKIVIVEGRTQFHFLPESIKIFIKVDLKEAARRIWKDLQEETKKKKRNEGEINSLLEMEQEIKKRDQNDARRYLKYYGFDHRNEKYYDLVIDSTNLSAEKVVEKIIFFINKKN